MHSELRDVTGFRGEKIVELCLTDYQTLPRPLFRPGFLGDKWPAIDFYVELTSIPGRRFYFFVQVKSTTGPLPVGSTHLAVSAKRTAVDRLLRVPGPTYIFGVHEPTKRVFVQSVHAGIAVRAITRIPLAHELHGANHKKLHQEVRRFWESTTRKPVSSVFA